MPHVSVSSADAQRFAFAEHPLKGTRGFGVGVDNAWKQENSKPENA